MRPGASSKPTLVLPGRSTFLLLLIIRLHVVLLLIQFSAGTVLTHMDNNIDDLQNLYELIHLDSILEISGITQN